MLLTIEVVILTIATLAVGLILALMGALAGLTIAGVIGGVIVGPSAAVLFVRLRLHIARRHDHHVHG